MEENTEKPIKKPVPILTLWMDKLKKLSILVGTWAVIFAVITILGFKIGFEYDDGLVFSTPAFKQAQKPSVSGNQNDYWNFLNRSYKLERSKLIPLTAAWMFKAFGFDIYIICMREDIGSDSIKHSWKPLITKFIFVENNLKKHKTLEKENFLLYFAGSDADIIQAKKADTTVIRIKRSSKSTNKTTYTPGKFNEFILPLSEF
ncbi:MAG: hypothetical protein KAR84_05005 [Elusimicrobiales bacterium]|nr:hypothetical protein [Elusimicrobiales bacterium]